MIVAGRAASVVVIVLSRGVGLKDMLLDADIRSTQFSVERRAGTDLDFFELLNCLVDIVSVKLLAVSTGPLCHGQTA